MNWPVKFGLSLHLHIFLGHLISLATANNRCNQFGPRSGILKKPEYAKKMKNYSNYSNKKVKKKYMGYQELVGFELTT